MIEDDDRDWEGLDFDLYSNSGNNIDDDDDGGADEKGIKPKSKEWNWCGNLRLTFLKVSPLFVESFKIDFKWKNEDADVDEDEDEEAPSTSVLRS